MKKIISILLMVMLIMLMSGCIAQREYDILLAAHDAAQAQVTSLQSDLAAAQSQIQTVQSDLTAEKSKAEKLESDLTAEKSKAEKLEGQLSRAESNYDTLKQKVDKLKPYGELLEKYYFVPLFEMTTEEFMVFSTLLASTDNDEVQDKWEAYLDSTTAQQEMETYNEFWFSVWDGLYEVLW